MTRYALGARDRKVFRERFRVRPADALGTSRRALTAGCARECAACGQGPEEAGKGGEEAGKGGEEAGKGRQVA